MDSFLVKLTCYVSALRSRKCILRLQGELTILKSHAASIPSRLAYALWVRVAPILKVTDIWSACLATEWGMMLEITIPINLFLQVVITWSLFWRRIWRLRRMDPLSAGWHQFKDAFHMCTSSRNPLELDDFVELGLISRVLSPYLDTGQGHVSFSVNKEVMDSR